MRVELGPRDVEKKEFVCVTRDIGKKETHPWEGVGPRIEAILKEMHQRMFDRQVCCMWLWVWSCGWGIYVMGVVYAGLRRIWTVMC